MAYARLFSLNIGHVFSDATIRVTAMTGAAAMEIGGRTTASEYKYMKAQDYATQAEIEDFRDTRLNIVDEISFADYDNVLANISDHLQKVTECLMHQFGKAAIVFLGDFCQLECINGNSIYSHRNGIYWEQALNCMVELQGLHRFKNCSKMSTIMPTMRAGGLTEAHLEILNSRVIGGVDENGKTIVMPDPRETRFATFGNAKRCEINANVFKQHLSQHHANATESDIPFCTIIIKSNARWSKCKKDLSFGQRKILFEECSEANIKNGNSKHCDPFLCLFSNSEIMLTGNEDVGNGKANGTTAGFQKAFLKPGGKLTPIKVHGYWVYSVDINDVDHLQCSWIGSSKYKGKFSVYPSVGTFTVQYPIEEGGKKIRVKAKIQFDYFEMVVNFATTGHKLQGKSLDQLVIAEWNKTKNWAYVVISRVRELRGLFLTEPIPKDFDFSPSPDYLEMMENFRNTIQASPEQLPFHQQMTTVEATMNRKID